MNNLPEVIIEYFHHKNNHNKLGLLSTFSDKAVVFDRGENKELHGQDQIELWIDKSLSGLNLKTEISEFRKEDDTWTIDTIVSGDFKASPAKFIYNFVLEQNKIIFLDIEFVGSAQS